MSLFTRKPSPCQEFFSQETQSKIQTYLHEKYPPVPVGDPSKALESAGLGACCACSNVVHGIKWNVPKKD